MKNARGRAKANEKAGRGMARAAEAMERSVPSMSERVPMDKAAAKSRRPAYASGGYAGKTSTESRMCKPTAARAGASFKGGKK
jgi:hypothetical protein